MPLIPATKGKIFSCVSNWQSVWAGLVRSCVRRLRCAQEHLYLSVPKDCPTPATKLAPASRFMGRLGAGPERLLTLRSGCFLGSLTPHPTPPWAPKPPVPSHRFGAMHNDGQAGGRVPCRGAMSVPRERRPQAGLAVREGGNPGPLRFRWQPEAVPVHLLPPGWLAVTTGSGLLSVPP